MMIARILAVAVLATVVPGLSAAAEPEPGRPVIYRGAALIDGTGAPLRRDVAIIVRGDRIEAIRPMSETPAASSEASEVIDVGGLHVLPGLIDSHVHLATAPNRRDAEAFLRRHVYSGVTAVRDMAGDARALADLSRAAMLGEIAAPDVHYAAVMAGASFFDDPRTARSTQGAKPGAVPWMQAITDQTDMKIAVAQARGTFATGIKIYAELPGSLVTKITEEAHRQGVAVWAHAAVLPASPAEVVNAGVDVVSHASFLLFALADQMPQRYRDLGSPDLIKNIMSRYSETHPATSKLLEDMRREGTILDATLRIGLAMEKQFPGSMDAVVHLARQAYRLAIPISTGTDTSAGRVEDSPYPLLHEELELLAERVGMAPADVLRSSALVGAMTLGREKDMGTIEPGKLANMVFVEKNPLESIANLRSVVLTVKRGTRYPREEFGREAPQSAR